MALALPAAGPKYDKDLENRRNLALVNADRQNQKNNQDVVIPIGRRLILTDTNGVQYALTVSTSGTLSAVAL